MSRIPDNAAKRKAKLKARKAHAEQHRPYLTARIAAALGVSVKKVSAREHGKATPSEAEMKAICEILNVGRT